MATITTDTYFDDSARTAGETWTINGCTLTIRTDTRWHANAPASMTGTMGQVYINPTLGGQFMIDARNVRWMAFDGGSGTVPAIGTTVTQGGVTGYLLGVWADYTSAPVAVGGAMPATGFLKFREVTGGQFIAGSALSGISANPLATPGSGAGADAPGWIEVAVDQGSNLALGGSLVSSHVFRGNWFYLDNTSGSRQQLIQLPTNGGGSGTMVQAVQIETAPGSGVYEWYPAINSTAWTTANFTTDQRAKYVSYAGGGAVRIGGDGTNSIGYLPVAGCKIRIPNIIGRQATSAARATNVASTTMSSRTRLSGGWNSDIEYLTTDWYVTLSSGSSTTFSNCALDQQVTVGAMLTSVSFNDVAVGIPQAFNGSSLAFSNCYAETVLSNVKLIAHGTSNIALKFSDCGNVTGTNVEAAVAVNRSTSYTAVNLSVSQKISFTNLKLRGGILNGSSAFGITINGLDFIDRLNGNTTTAASLNMITLNSCNNVYVDGITFGDAGALTACNPYGALVQTSNSNNIVVRNGGTLSNPLDCGSNSTLYPQYIHQSNASTESNIKIQRIYLPGTRNATIMPRNGGGSRSHVYEHLYGSRSSAVNNLPADSIVRGVSGKPLNANPTTTTGTFFTDGYTSDTVGYVQFTFTPLSDFSSPFITTNLTNVNSGFNGQNAILLKSVGEYIIAETPYWVKGYTGFENSTPLFNQPGTSGNFTKEYQIDSGSGWGTWKTLSGANLSVETISPSGFKMRVRITTAVANNGNEVTFVKMNTTTTLTAQSSNLYDLDTSTLSFTGLQPGSEVRCYTGSDPASAVEIGGIESTSGSTFSFSHSSGGSVGFIRIFALGYQPVTYDPFTFSSSDQSILVQQVVDRNYSNPA